MDANIDRRSFVKAMGALGALSAVGAQEIAAATPALAADATIPAPMAGKPLEATIDTETGKVAVNENVVVRYSACLGCYSSCGNRMKLDRETGQLLTVGGNPYHPSCSFPYLNFDEPLEKAYESFGFATRTDAHGTVCGRGQGTQDACTRPDRLTTPLKRAGKRGEGKWKSISWDQLITEVTEGGALFADIGETTPVTGFRELHDTQTPMKAEQPDLGPVSNQFVMMGGRGDGRTVIGTRFVNNFGSINSYGHGSS